MNMRGFTIIEFVLYMSIFSSIFFSGIASLAALRDSEAGTYARMADLMDLLATQDESDVGMHVLD